MNDRRRAGDSHYFRSVCGQSSVIGHFHAHREDAGRRRREDNGLPAGVIKLAIVVKVPRIGERVIARVGGLRRQNNGRGHDAAVRPSGVYKWSVVEDGDLRRIHARFAKGAGDRHGERENTVAVVVVQVQHRYRTRLSRHDRVRKSAVAPVNHGGREFRIQRDDAGLEGDGLAFKGGNRRARLDDGSGADRPSVVFDEHRFVDVDQRRGGDRRAIRDRDIVRDIDHRRADRVGIVGYRDTVLDIDHRRANQPRIITHRDAISHCDVHRADHRYIVRYRDALVVTHHRGRFGLRAVAHANAFLDEDIHWRRRLGRNARASTGDSCDYRREKNGRYE